MPTIKATVEVDFEAFCANCGRGICHLVTPTRSGDNIRVELCDECLASEREDGVDQGREEAEKECEQKLYEVDLAHSKELEERDVRIAELEAKVAELAHELNTKVR